MKIILAFVMCAVGLYAQDAKIIVLEPSETEAAKTAYQAIVDAQKQFDELQAELVKKYELGQEIVLNFNPTFTAALPSTEIAQARRMLGCWNLMPVPLDLAKTLTKQPAR